MAAGAVAELLIGRVAWLEVGTVIWLLREALDSPVNPPSKLPIESADPTTGCKYGFMDVESAEIEDGFV
ncbi:MAG: hypothetical protein QNK90_11265 [Opitutaceae bacterium]